MSAAARRDDGSYEIDPAELTRCFPPRNGGNGHATDGVTQYATPLETVATAAFEAQIAGLREVGALLRTELADAKDDRDRWRSQAEATQRLLSDATARRPWWKRLAG